MARRLPKPKEIVDVFNVNQSYADVEKQFNWTPNYCKYMVDEALKKMSVTAPEENKVVEQVVTVKEDEPEVIKEEPTQDATTEPVVEVEDVKEEVKTEPVIIKEDKPMDSSKLTTLRTNVDPKRFTPEIIGNYIEREVDSLVKSFTSLGRNICLIGESGTGKTTLVENFAAKSRLPFLRVSCDETSSLKTLLGSREIIDGTTYFRGSAFLELLQMPSVILFDEFNALHSSKLFFLHELLDNRQIFVQDSDGGSCIKIHDDCQIFLACNPCNKNYGGTNKMNAALGNRTTIIDVPIVKVEEMESLFECGEFTENLKQFYTEISKVISDRQIRVAFSLRNIIRAVEAIKSGIQPLSALKYEFYNSALLTSSEVERDVIEGVGLRIFGR